MQSGVPIWEAAGFLGMSPEVLRTPTATTTLTICREQRLPLGKKAGSFRWLNRWLTSGTSTNQKEKPNDFWSEWQDLNLRPLRPERSALPG